MHTYLFTKAKSIYENPNHSTSAQSMSETPVFTSRSRLSVHLAGSSTAGDVLALGARLSTSDTVARPLPARARALAAKQVDVGARRSDGALDAGDSKVGDWDASGGGTGRAAVLVVLLNDDTVLGDVAQGDAAVGDAGDLAGSAGDRLDTDAVVRVADLAVRNEHSVDGVV